MVSRHDSLCNCEIFANLPKAFVSSCRCYAPVSHRDAQCPTSRPRVYTTPSPTSTRAGPSACSISPWTWCQGSWTAPATTSAPQNRVRKLSGIYQRLVWNLFYDQNQCHTCKTKQDLTFIFCLNDRWFMYTGLFGTSIPIRAVLADQSASVFGSGDYLCIVTIHGRS